MMKKNEIVQAKSDLKYLYDTYGRAREPFGAYYNLWDILIGEETILLDTIIAHIKHYFDKGFETKYSNKFSDLFPDIGDIKIKEIVERYNIDVGRIKSVYCHYEIEKQRAQYFANKTKRPVYVARDCYCHNFVILFDDDSIECRYRIWETVNPEDFIL